VPELPEVETVTRSLAPIVGRRIVSAEFTCLRILRGGDPDRMSARLAGARIASIKRYGKFILVALTEQSRDRKGAVRPAGYLTVHLGMTGKLLSGAGASACQPSKHTHAIFNLDRGVLLYDDSRQFGRIQFSDDFPARILKLGPEPLEISYDDFYAGLRRRKTRIKALLLNQDFLRGIGNIYADEALFRAGIHPLALAHRIRPDRARRLYDAFRAVLTEAIEAGGSSISDYVDAQGRQGFFQFSHRVYQRTGEPCITCGAPIRRILVAQRSSHFCPRCQKR
jgi:formamidopyrimidine-DNA glycosylase